MRKPSVKVQERQEARWAERWEALQERLAKLTEAAPNANPADIKYLAINHAEALDRILAVLASK